MNDNYTIKQATINDITTIHALICDFATYLKHSTEFIATTEDLQRELFERNRASVLLLFFEDTPIGYLVYSYHLSTFRAQSGIYIEDIFVYEEHRGKGLGKRLFSEISSIALRENVPFLNWNCLKWNTDSIEFYQNIGATHDNDTHFHFQLDRAQIEKLATPSPSK